MEENNQKPSGRIIPFSEEKRIDVIRTLIATGNHRFAAEQHGIAYPTLMQWKQASWWPELYNQVKQEQRAELGSKLNALTNEALEIMKDRMENGEYILNNKTGELIRKPIGIRDANQAMNNLLTQANKIEELNSRSTTVDESVGDVLKQLAQEFAKFAKKKPEIVDVEFKEV